MKYSDLLKLDESSKQILKVVAENDGIRSKALGAKVHLSRAPILQRTKKLGEKGLLLRNVVPGTEKNSRPTYSYTLMPGVDVAAITGAIAGLSVEAYSSSDNLETEQNQPIPLVVDCSAFEVIEELLEVAFCKIVELEQRLMQVEETLFDCSAIDRVKLLAILKS